MTETQRLYALGGKVGTKLIGTDLDGTVNVIEITGIGMERILARCIETNGEPWDGKEANWTLTLRDWKVKND